ncbi:hypothetical protein GCM10009087_09850 [Sphingomonas oligophenolica]|uniref:DUF4893 domain-containing protein n=1 Tax=Sphingomonas oligophenolica TaxID=301154 RepID=A0ABU9Y8M2_9SPHN
MRRAACSLALCLLAATIGGCAAMSQRHRPMAMVEAPDDPGRAWKERIGSADAARLDALPARWSAALAAARPHFAATLAREGVLLVPARALRYPALPPGSYRCRAVKLGAAGPRRPAWRSFPPAFCFVGSEADAQSFTKQTGSERAAGWLYPDGGTRMVFLGAFAEGTAAAPVYGAAKGHNAVGVVERIAHFRWRLTLVPTDGSAQLTIYDLTPVPVEGQIPETE